MKAWVLAGMIVASGLAGCQHTEQRRDFTPVLARFHLEAAGSDGLPAALPQSGVRLAVNPQPVLTEGDVVNVELVQVDLGPCLLFQLTSAAARDLYRLSVTHQGRRLVIFINGTALGARRIDGPIADGALFVFVEVPDLELGDLATKLKRSAVAFQRELARKG